MISGPSGITAAHFHPNEARFGVSPGCLCGEYQRDVVTWPVREDATDLPHEENDAGPCNRLAVLIHSLIRLV